MNESTPLLNPSPVPKDVHSPKAPLSARQFYLILFTTFISITTLSITATPMVFSLRKFACEEVYKDDLQLLVGPKGRRCDVKEVDALFAKYMSYYTTVSRIVSILSILVANRITKSFSLKAAVLNQTLWPSIRTVIQILSLSFTASTGAYILILAHIVNILGSFSGYALVTHTLVAELAGSDGAARYFGQLQGVNLLAISLGVSGGGVLAQRFGLRLPFQVEAIGLLASTALAWWALPGVEVTVEDTTGVSPAEKRWWKSLFGWLEPIMVFAPARMVDERTGREHRYWGLPLLGTGILVSYFAGSYVPTMIQLTAVSSFGFSPTQTSYLLTMLMLLGAFHITFIFPPTLKLGRRFFSSTCGRSPFPDAVEETIIPAPATIVDPSLPSVQESTAISTFTNETHDSTFDLIYYRAELIYSTAVFLLAGFIAHRWQIYGIGVLVALGGGGLSLSKALVLDLVKPNQRSDALSAMFLFDNLGGLAASNVFGLIFACLTSSGYAHLTLFITSAFNGIAALPLLAVKFPPSSWSRTP